MSKRIHIDPGTRFGQLVALEETFFVKKGRKRYTCLCQCDCGKTPTVARHRLLGGQKSCGCVTLKKTIERNTKHGCAERNHKTKEYTAWCNMHARCNNPNNDEYECYGGRGIQVCDRWAHFENFLKDMGVCPTGMTLDRKETDGNYKPSNCRWVDSLTQQNNRTNNIEIEWNGKVQTVSQWERELKFPPNRLHARLHRGWTVEAALTRPLRHWPSQRKAI